MKVLSNIVDDSNNENNFPHKLLLTNTQVLRLPQAFANNSSANMKLSKTQLHRKEQPGGFLGRLLAPLLKTVFKTLAKSVLIPLGLTSAASATDAAIHKKMFVSETTTLIVSNEEINNIMKIIKSLEESGLLIKGVSETIKNEAKEQKRRFLETLSGILSASLLGNLLTGKDIIKAGEKALATCRRQGTIRSGQDFQCRPILKLILKYESVIKMNVNLMVFIQEIVCLK